MRHLTVYGTWFMIVLSFVVLVFLAVGLIVWAPIIIAVAIAAIVVAGVVWSRSRSRTQQLGSEHASAAQDRRDAGQTQRPSASGAPVSGEGGAADAQRARLREGG
jgi:Flp pilus assembly protein TadB